MNDLIEEKRIYKNRRRKKHEKNSFIYYNNYGVI